MLILKQEEIFPLSPYQKLMKCMVDYEVLNFHYPGFKKWVLPHWFIRNSKAKTAFVTPFGKYQFEAVPFGLAQALAYFQQLISIVLQGYSDFAMAYLDDIIIFSKNEAEHLKHIEIIFQKLKEAGLKLKESKCDFFKKEIHYLGHLI